ncbi:MAG: alpha/beta hydrolase [Vulcanimicrobiaceae bacterium]
MIAAPGATGLAAYRALPPSPSAALLFVHGFAEHARRHEATLVALAERGIATFAFDLRGHGSAAGTRDYVGDFTRLVADTAAMRREVARTLPGVPLFIAGFSMGGLVALRSAADEPSGLAGMILIAPGLDPAGGVPLFVKRLGVLVGRYVPFLPVARVDFQRLDAAPGEPRRRRVIAARTAAELMRASSLAFRTAAQVRLPALIFHGECDRLVSERGPRRFAAALGGADVTLRIVPGGEHELLREPTGRGVREEIVAWIAARSGEDDRP